MNKSDIGTITEPEVSKPDIFEFTDHREFLRKWLTWKKTDNPRYSGAMFAKSADLNSHTLLGMVIRGQRNLGYDAIKGFSRALRLTGKRNLYFEKLVLYNQAKNARIKERLFYEMIEANRNKKSSQLSTLKNYSIYLSSWHYSAVRELVHLKDFQPDANWIASKLKNKITARKASDIWKVLKELGFVYFNEKTKKYEVKDKAIDIAPGTRDFVIRNYHRDHIKKSLESIDDEANENRELSSLTIAVTEEEFNNIKERINSLRQDINTELSDSNGLKDHVITLNSQVLVLTRRNKNGGSENV